MAHQATKLDASRIALEPCVFLLPIGITVITIFHDYPLESWIENKQPRIDQGTPTLAIDIIPMPVTMANISSMNKHSRPASPNVPVAMIIIPQTYAIFLATVLW